MFDLIQIDKNYVSSMVNLVGGGECRLF